MKLKPVKNDGELNRALKRIDELWGAKPNTSKGDELDVLMLIVEKYEDENFAIPSSDPIEAIKFLMEQNGKNAALPAILVNMEQALRYL